MARQPCKKFQFLLLRRLHHGQARRGLGRVHWRYHGHDGLLSFANFEKVVDVEILAEFRIIIRADDHIAPVRRIAQFAATVSHSLALGAFYGR